MVMAMAMAMHAPRVMPEMVPVKVAADPSMRSCRSRGG